MKLVGTKKVVKKSDGNFDGVHHLSGSSFTNCIKRRLHQLVRNGMTNGLFVHGDGLESKRDDADDSEPKTKGTLASGHEEDGVSSLEVEVDGVNAMIPNSKFGETDRSIQNGGLDGSGSTNPGLDVDVRSESAVSKPNDIQKVPVSNGVFYEDSKAIAELDESLHLVGDTESEAGGIDDANIIVKTKDVNFGGWSRYGRLRKKRSIGHEEPSPKRQRCKDTTFKKFQVDKNGDSRLCDKTEPCVWLVGDLVWAKIGGHPWWPGMVSYDPLVGIFTDVQLRDVKKNVNDTVPRSKYRRYYHIQFFGDVAERAWAFSKNIMRFEGLVQFREYVQRQVDAASPYLRAKVKASFEVRPNRTSSWEIAIQEAESVLSMTRDERKHHLIFLYEDKHKSQARSRAVKQVQAISEHCGAAGQKRPRQRSISPKTPLDSQPRKARQRKKLVKDKNATQCQADVDKIALELPEREAVVLDIKDEIVTDTCVARQGCRSRPNEKQPGEDIKIVNPSRKRQRKSGKISQKPAAKRCRNSGSTEDLVAPKGVKSNGRKKSLKVVKTSPKSRKPSGPNSNQAEDMSTANTNLLRLGDSGGDFAASAKCPKETLEPRCDKLCQICENLVSRVDDMVRCTGPCISVFHLSCIGLQFVPVGFKCDECTSGIHTCFICKKSGGEEVQRCNVPHCGKFYHMECLQRFRQTRFNGRPIACPHHACLSCALNSSRPSSTGRGRLYRCIRCPTAYHGSGDLCLAAGSVIIASSSIICPRHYQPSKKSRSRNKHINVDWCFVCSSGGSLICCESCPAAFHVECLQIQPPEGSYFCDECLSGSQPRYGDIVWVKLASYRWWPAVVRHPKTVPTNILNLPHDAGEFPVQFFGTHDYYWTNRSRMFQFIEGDRSGRSTTYSYLVKLFNQAVEEAVAAYKQWKLIKEKRDAENVGRANSKPVPFRFIKMNKPYGKVQMFAPDSSTLTPCECDPKSENPCSSDSDCLNRILMFECDPVICPAGPKCQNQRFQMREYPPVEAFKTEGKGWGLRTLVDIKKGDFVNEYVGEVIDEEECRRRMEQMHKSNDENYYFLTLDNNRIIDAGPKGNNSRFMNHSCQPNCEMQKWTVMGDTRVGLFALRDIAAGEELTFNYNLDCLGNEKTTCNCRTEVCSGYIGDRPKNSNLSAVDKKSHKKPRKRKPRLSPPHHEDECFRCGEGGELVLCDRRKCPKAYHLSCLNLTKPPHGRWDCPWHHCDVCGKNACFLCSLCPNSFCKNHSDDSLVELESGKLVCGEHQIGTVKADAGVTSELKEHASEQHATDDVAVSVVMEAASFNEESSSRKKKRRRRQRPCIRLSRRKRVVISPSTSRSAGKNPLLNQTGDTTKEQELGSCNSGESYLSMEGHEEQCSIPLISNAQTAERLSNGETAILEVNETQSDHSESLTNLSDSKVVTCKTECVEQGSTLGLVSNSEIDCYSKRCILPV